MKTISPAETLWKATPCPPNCDAINAQHDAIRDAQNRLLEMRITALVAVVVIVLLVVLWLRRRAIARRLDSAAVGTLATGVKLSRSLAAKGRRYRDRIIDRANR